MKTQHRKSSVSKQIEPLAVASYAAFAPYVNPYGCGVKGYWLGKLKLSRIKTENLRHLSRGHYSKGSYKADDYWHEIKEYKFDERLVNQHMVGGKNGKVKSYFTGGLKGKSLLMLDTDAHHEFQKPFVQQAVALLNRTLPQGYPLDRDSKGGHHHYIKVDYRSFGYGVEAWDRVQQMYLDLAHVLDDLMLAHGILLDMEAKGAPDGTMRGSLALFPFCQFNPCTGRDSWNYSMLESFRAITEVKVRDVVGWIKDFRTHNDQYREVIETNRAKRQALKDAERKESQRENVRVDARHVKAHALQVEGRVRTASGVLPGSGSLRDEGVPAVGAFLPQQTREGAMGHAALVNPRITANLRPNPERILHWRSIHDSFRRQREALRWLCRKLGRVATVAEALAFLKANVLYTGTWQDNLGGRTARVRQILNYIAKTFDPDLCASRTSGPVFDADLHCYARVIENYIGTSVETYRDGLDEYGQPTRHAKRVLTSEELSAVYGVVKWCIPNSLYGDGSAPHVFIVAKTGLSNEVVSRSVPLLKRWGFLVCDLNDYGPDHARRYKLGIELNPEWYKHKATLAWDVGLDLTSLQQQQHNLLFSPRTHLEEPTGQIQTCEVHDTS